MKPLSLCLLTLTLTMALGTQCGDVVVVSSDFTHGGDGWSADFSDYPVGTLDPAFQAGVEPLPPELGLARTGFRIQASNTSDDLFLFLKKSISEDWGIEPDREYEVSFLLVFASNAPSLCGGIGGSPGESVALKAGAVDVEPIPVDDGKGFIGLNVDKGNQSAGGPAASVVGNIANGLPCDSVPFPPPFKTLVRFHSHEFTVRSSADGDLWLLVGTDSGFEGVTTLYYLGIAAILRPL